jgi:hypothetical protein
MAMTAMQHGAARADASTFYAGLALLLLSIVIQNIRRYRASCRPVLRLRHSGWYRPTASSCSDASGKSPVGKDWGGRGSTRERS